MRIISFAVLLLLLQACGSNNLFISDGFKYGNDVKDQTKGILVVHTYAEILSGNSELIYKPYSVFLQDGTLYKEVPAAYGKPESVFLNEGTYVIIAEMYNGSKEIIEAEVKSGKVFELRRDMLSKLDL